MRISEVFVEIEKDHTVKFRRMSNGRHIDWLSVKMGRKEHRLYIDVDDVIADDWEIKPKPKTLRQINYETYVNSEMGYLPWEQLSVKGDYERAAQAVLAAAKEREGADRA